MTAPEPPKLYTLHQVAGILRLPYEHVRSRVFSGSWPHRKFSERNRRMTEEDIALVLELVRSEGAQKREPVAAAPTGRSAATQRNERVRRLMRAV